MAAVDLATLASVLGTILEDKIQHVIPRAVPLLPFLPVIGADGKNVSWTAVVGGSDVTRGGAIADGALVSTINTDTKRNAYLDFAVYEDAFGTTGLARAGAKVTGNPKDLENLFAEELEECVTGLTAKISRDIWTGVGSDASPGQIRGLLAANGGILATGTYANIDRSVYTRWAGVSELNGGVPRPLSKDLMRTLRRRIYVASNRKPDLWVCSPLTHQLFGQVSDQSRRQIQDIYLRGQKLALDVGYNYLDFDGTPCIEDPSCPDGYMVALCTPCVCIRTLPPAEPQAEINLHGTEEEQFGASNTSLKAKIRLLPYSGDTDPFALYTYLQLQVKRPNCCGYIGDLPTSL